MKTIDLDLLLMDFAQGWQEKPEQALAALQELLLDETACLARMEMLRRVAKQAQERFPNLPGKSGPTDFAAEIRAIIQTSPFHALQEGKLDPERLHALTCDPDALWQAHLALVEEEGLEEPSPVSGSVEGSEATESQASPVRPGLTLLVRQGRMKEAEEGLRPYLRPLLRRAELPEDLAEELLAFVLKRASKLEEGRPFRDAVLDWVSDFAHERKMQAALAGFEKRDWLAIAEEGAVRQVIDAQFLRSPQPGWANDFLRLCRKSQVSTLQELASVELAGDYPALPGFRRNLMELGERKRNQGIQFLLN